MKQRGFALALVVALLLSTSLSWAAQGEAAVGDPVPQSSAASTTSTTSTTSTASATSAIPQIARASMERPTVCMEGGTRVLAVETDGDLWLWGRDSLKEGNSTFYGQPIKLMEGAVAVRASGATAWVLKADNSLWVLYYGGVLGPTGSVSKIEAPVKVLDNVISYSARGTDMVAVTADGGLWYSGLYTLKVPKGDHYATATVPDQSPMRVMDGVKGASIGDGCIYIIKNDDTLWGFGRNDSSQLTGERTGQTYHRQDSPIKILDEVSTVTYNNGGGLAIKKDGSLWIWGAQTYAPTHNVELLYNTERQFLYKEPVKVLDQVAAVSSEGSQTIAVQSDGSIWTWGLNTAGQLGNGTTEHPTSQNEFFPTPTKIASGGVAVHSTGYNILFLKEDGSLWGAGVYGYGSLLNGGNANSRPTYKTLPIKVRDGIRLPG